MGKKTNPNLLSNARSVQYNNYIETQWSIVPQSCTVRYKGTRKVKWVFRIKFGGQQLIVKCNVYTKCVCVYLCIRTCECLVPFRGSCSCCWGSRAEECTHLGPCCQRPSLTTAWKAGELLQDCPCSHSHLASLPPPAPPPLGPGSNRDILNKTSAMLGKPFLCQHGHLSIPDTRLK